MTYDLFIGDRLYSSWSLRGWLSVAAFGLPVRVHMIGLYSGTIAQDLAPLKPARLVPVLQLPNGTVVAETLAIAETLAERHPEAGLWPEDPRQRATARWLTAEMASGFGALREDCPMQLSHVWRGFEPSSAVQADLDRLDALWTHARAVAGTADGWLFGAYSLADVFFTPVAARIVGYDLPVSEAARAYSEALLATPQMHDWRSKSLKAPRPDPEPYRLDHHRDPWPFS